MQPRTTPTRLRQAGLRELAVSWGDGHQSLYAVRGLRLACPCATCVHELTGAPLLDPESVPPEVRPTEIQPVGRYGIRIVWSDGHDTGILTFRSLRDRCPCEGCRAEPGGNR